METVLHKVLKYLSLKVYGVYLSHGIETAQLLTRHAFDSLEETRMLHGCIFSIESAIPAFNVAERLIFIVARLVLRNSRHFCLSHANTNILCASPVNRICSHYNNHFSKIDTKHQFFQKKQQVMYSSRTYNAAQLVYVYLFVMYYPLVGSLPVWLQVLYVILLMKSAFMRNFSH